MDHCVVPTVWVTFLVDPGSILSLPQEEVLDLQRWQTFSRFLLGTTSASFDLADLAFIDEPMKTRVAVSATPLK